MREENIGAADLLREMARRRAANPAWNDAVAIGHSGHREEEGYQG
jgi:hypothetical protein